MLRPILHNRYIDDATRGIVMETTRCNNTAAGTLLPAQKKKGPAFGRPLPCNRA